MQKEKKKVWPLMTARELQEIIKFHEVCFKTFLRNQKVIKHPDVV